MAGLSRLAKSFKSTLSSFAKQHKMDAMPGKQWEAYIKANAPKDAKKEAEATGLYQMLEKYEGKVTKDQIEQHLKKKLPKIKTKETKSEQPVTQRDIVDSAAYEDPITLEGDRYVIESTPNGYSLLDSDGNVIRNERTSGDLADYINDKYRKPGRYEQYTLPGGKDYKETLIQLERDVPEELPEGWEIRELERNGQKIYQPVTPSTVGREWNEPGIANAELRRYFANKLKGEDYTSSHFTEPNILAHLRSKQRRLPTGEGVHFLEEIQSDWGQGLRGGKQLPSAPYVTDTEDWTKLALKKAIEDAAEGGQDYLAWTSGAQQAGRYNLDDTTRVAGMESYYDRIVPSTANNLMKQLGLSERVQMLDIPEIGQQPGIRITPELRKKVEEGLPYFSMGAAPLATDEDLPGYGKGGVVRSRITELMKMIENITGAEGGKRLQRAADEVPNLEDQYTQNALRSAFIGDNATGLMVMHPRAFENYATPIPQEFVDPTYINELAAVRKSGGFKDIPFLELNKSDKGELFVSGHEGRHRTRAMTDVGDAATLVRMLPRASLREPFPRYSNEEYLRALREELGTRPLVRPERDYEGEKRGLMVLPELFAKGGEVDVDDEQYEFINSAPPVRIEPRFNYNEGRVDKTQHKNYNLGADVDLFDKYGVGADMYGYDVKTPYGRYKDTGIANIRGRYTTDEGVTYGAGYSPENKAYRLSRTNRDGDTLSLERTAARPTMETQTEIIPGEDETTWVKYSKNFAKGGEVDYDAMYDFKEWSKKWLTTIKNLT